MPNQTIGSQTISHPGDTGEFGAGCRKPDSRCIDDTGAYTGIRIMDLIVMFDAHLLTGLLPTKSRAEIRRLVAG